MSTRLSGHVLWAEGAAFDADGRRIHWSRTGGAGHAICECGATSPTLPSAAARKRWHREHKQQIREARLMSLAPDDPRHGTVNGYVNLACRCAECTEAQRIAVAKARARRRAATSIPSSVEHGNPNTYTNWSCRCRKCRDAVAAYARRRYKPKKAAS